MDSLDLVERIDEEAAELLVDPGRTYEVSLGVAGGAQVYVGDATLGEGASLIRDVFGTWAQIIHTRGHVGGSTIDEAAHAHAQIAAAIADWVSGGRDDPLAFGRRWRSTLDRVDARWLEAEGTMNTALEE